MSETANESTRTEGGDMSSLLTTLLSDPEVLSRVGDTLAALTQNARNAENGEESTEDTKNAESSEKKDSEPNEKASTVSGEAQLGLPELLSKLAASSGTQSPELKREIDLLRAIRPYLSPRRQEMIDGFIQMSKLGEIFKNLSDGGKNVLQ